MSILKTNLSCFKQNGLFVFDYPGSLNIFRQSEVAKRLIDSTSRPMPILPLKNIERNAIYDYSTQYSYTFNHKLRDEIPLTEVENSDRERLLSAMEKFQDFEGEVYRRIGFGYPGKATQEDYRKFLKFIEENKKGTIFKTPQFISGSLIEGRYPAASEYVVTMLINSKTGKAVENFSQYPLEREILFKPFTPFEIMDADWINEKSYAMIWNEVK